MVFLWSCRELRCRCEKKWNNWSKVAPRLLKWFKFLRRVKEPDGFKIQFLSFSNSLQTHHLAETENKKTSIIVAWEICSSFPFTSLNLSRIYCGFRKCSDVLCNCIGCPLWCLHVTLIDDEKYFHFDPFRRKHFESELKSIDDSVTHDRDGDALFSTSVHWNNNKYQQIKSNNTINSWTVENRMLFRLIQRFGNDEKYIRFIIKTRSFENIRKLNQQNVKLLICVGENDVRKCCGA